MKFQGFDKSFEQILSVFERRYEYCHEVENLFLNDWYWPVKRYMKTIQYLISKGYITEEEGQPAAFGITEKGNWFLSKLRNDRNHPSTENPIL